MNFLSYVRNRYGDYLPKPSWGAFSDRHLEQELRGVWPRPVIGLPKHLDYEWVVGLPWYFKNIKGIRVLDAGFMAHLEFTKLLVKLGFEVYGVDLQAYKTKEFVAIEDSVWNIGAWQLSRFDTIIANSLLEHLGLNCYGQPEFKEAQKATMDAFRDRLELGGVLLLQVPYGKHPVLVRYRGQDFYRVSTSESLQSLLEPFNIQEKVFFVKATKGWFKVSESVADKVQQGGGFPSCLVYVKAVKAC